MDIEQTKLEQTEPEQTKKQIHMLVKSISVCNFIYDITQVKLYAELIDITYNTHQIFIAARTKYNRAIKTKRHIMCLRTFTHYTIDKFLQLVKSYEVPMCNYIDDDGKEFPEDCLVLYCSTNGRDTKKAAHKFLIEMLNGLLYCNDKNSIDSNDKNSIDSNDKNSIDNIDKTKHNANGKKIYDHMHSKLNSVIMSSKGPTKLITMDIDDKSMLDEILEYLASISIEPTANIETKGGYHLMLPVVDNIQFVYKKYKEKITIGDIYCPIPGTLQAGFPVRFVGDIKKR